MGKSNLLIGSIAILGIIGGGWLLTNYKPITFGLIFTILSSVGLMVAVLARPIGRFFSVDVPDDGGGGLALGKQLGLSFLGVVPIILFLTFSLSIGVPALTLSVLTNTLITVFLAPIVEEVFFLFVVPFLVGMYLRKLGIAGFILNLLVSSFIFSVYHWLAYGATFLVGGAFIGAFVFRLLTLIVVAWIAKSTIYVPATVGRGIVTAILMHFMFNAFIVVNKLVIVPEVVS